MGLLNSIFGNSVSIENVYNALKKIEISPNQLKSEKTIENIIAKNLSEIFGASKVHQQYSIPGYFGMKVDIDVGDGAVGIELKLASALDNSVSNVQRLFGQAIYYSKRQYNSNLIIAIIGNSIIQEKPYIQEIQKHLNEIGVDYVYIATKRRS